MKTSLNKKPIAFGLGVICVAFIGYLLFNSNSPSTDLRLGKATIEDISQKVTLAGKVIPKRKTLITAPFEGYVQKLFVKIGDKVKTGDPLVSVVQSLTANDGSFPMRSPLNGTVVQISKIEGEYSKQSGTILRIDDMSELLVMADAPEIDRVKLRIDQTAIIKATPILDKKYKGKISSLSLSASEDDSYRNAQNVNFPILVSVIDPDGQLNPGMSVVMDVEIDKRSQSLFLRHEFIRQENDEYFVLLKSGEKKPIKVGLQNEDGFEILEGITTNDEIRQIDFSEIIKGSP